MTALRAWLADALCRWWGHHLQPVGQPEIACDIRHTTYLCQRCYTTFVETEP